jgi:AcrR family transcriptional regulator
MTTPSNTRQTILQAACRLVEREGVARLTLDAVAQEAGLSKGGLRYHFPSKDSLIAGMVTYLLQQFAQDLEHAHITDDTDPGAWLRAYIRASCSTAHQDIDSASGLLAAVANDPTFLEPLRTQYSQWQKQAEGDGISAARATVIRLALDGLWFADIFGFASPTGPLREQVITELLALTKGKGDSH